MGNHRFHPGFSHFGSGWGGRILKHPVCATYGIEKPMREFFLQKNKIYPYRPFALSFLFLKWAHSEGVFLLIEIRFQLFDE